ncbi:hypothetical protein FDH38_gp119 [Dinoroseobacter phage vB_DshS-R5C]|uniref:Uncharacterized protein n=1 Tax=Dinoroseobacter phage vB_DshS-R5C TaxID=1965368 RepID=A0A1V0DYE1_9CAUD|nr:hypothetical protein FDH38_gp119 [Dinoroseobacter phage vB_DshS-R5C]ARB06173.1 hypothetical protein vBDshSR5C_119 [Dinoroseobacter phage vB_DshS-R5C]
MPSLDGFVIVPPISPWDEKHRDAIELDNAMRTFGRTSAEAWRIHVRAGLDNLDSGEVSRRIQHWHDRGYRVREATLTIEAPP